VVDQCRIQDRTRYIFDVGKSADRRASIENPNLVIARDQRRYKVLPDEASTASDKYPGHERGSGPACCSLAKDDERSCGSLWMIAARSRRIPSAIKSFAVTNIGPSRKWEGLSTSAGWHCSNTRWPTIWKAMPMMIRG